MSRGAPQDRLDPSDHGAPEQTGTGDGESAFESAFEADPAMERPGGSPRRAKRSGRGLSARLNGFFKGGGSAAKAAAEEADPAASAFQARRKRRGFVHSLAFRVAMINLIGLMFFAIGLAVFTQLRTSLLDERSLALGTHSRIIAGALSNTAIVDRSEQAPGLPSDKINPDLANRVLRNLVLPTGYRARIYDVDGTLLADSWLLDRNGQVVSRPLETPDAPLGYWQELGRLFDRLAGIIPDRDVRPYIEGPGLAIPEVQAALAGRSNAEALRGVKRTGQGQLIVQVAQPVQKLQAIVGALLVTTEGDDINQVLAAERVAIFQIFLLALGVNVLAAVIYARTVVRPIHMLAEAAERVRYARPKERKTKAELPDFSARRDEIGDLAASLKEMTRALNSRIEAIEQFAADVSHEIKNPLTSLRSAVETLQNTRSPQAMERLMPIILDDVGRLDRLITDISDASRLDAELSREAAEPVDLPRLLEGLVTLLNETRDDDGARIELRVDTGALPASVLTVLGIDGRLAQVFRNILTNACSFSPKNAVVLVSARLEETSRGRVAVVTVDDDGPGLPEGAQERIFERFYTERPEGEAFGKNSGLGLSISRQIVEAHGGAISAVNLRDVAETPQAGGAPLRGARFTVRLPAVKS